MPKSLLITSPRPAPEEMESHFGFSKARKKELQVLVDEFEAQLHLEEAPAVPTIPEKRRTSASAA